MLKNILVSIGILFTLVAGVWGATTVLDSRHASKSDLSHLEQTVSVLNDRIQYNFAKDQLYDAEQEKYKIEMQFGTDCSSMPEVVRDRYRKLILIIEELRKGLEVIHSE